MSLHHTAPYIRLLAGIVMALSAALAASANVAPSKRTVNTPNAVIAYAERGDRDGRPIVFLHGLPFSSFIWRNVMDALADDGFRLLAPDLVGFGDSSGEGYGVLDQVAHLDAFLDAMSVEEPILVGHDWGAGIALIWAGENPNAVAGFATMEGAMPPVYPRPAYDAMPEPLARMFRSMREAGAEARVLDDNLWIETILPSMTVEPLSPAVRAEYERPFPTPASRRPLLAMSRTLPIGGVPADVVAAYERGVSWWTGASAPKLVIYAEPGRLYGPELAEWSAIHAPTVTLAGIGPGLHAIQEETPDAVAEALSTWLATLPVPTKP